MRLAPFVHSYLLAFAAAALAALVLTPLAIRLGHRLELLDHPGPRKIHHKPQPLLGGMVIYTIFMLLCVVAPYLVHALRDTPVWRAAWVPDEIQSYLASIHIARGRIAIVMIGGSCMFLIGLADDLWDLTVGARLLLMTLVAAGVVAAGVRPVLGFLPGPVVSVVTVIWIVGISNAMNLLDGMDGLAAGVAAISATLLAVVLALGQQPSLALLLAVFSGSLLGFLRFNFHPARIFLGSSGSIFLGFILGVVCLFADFMLPGSQTYFPILLPLLVLGVPIYDTAGVILTRLFLRQPVLRGDKNHVHHRLMRLGMGQRSVVLYLYLFSFALGVNGTLLVHANWLEGGILLVQLLAIFGLFAILERVVWKADRATGRYDQPDPPAQRLPGAPREAKRTRQAR